MSNLFSHAVPAPVSSGPLRDIVCSASVPREPAEAYTGFTEYVHLWWPAVQLSVWGAETFFSFDGGLLSETSPEQAEVVWAEPENIGQADIGQEDAGHLTAQPGPGSESMPKTVHPEPGAVDRSARSLDLRWHHRTGSSVQTQVTIAFCAAGSGTDVSLVHTGWVQADADVHQVYSRFWPHALDAYVRFMGGSTND